MSRLVAHYQVLLNSIVADPGCPISELNIMTEEELGNVERWNNTTTSSTGSECIHKLFEDQVERSKDRVAIANHIHELTYGELDEEANKLARHLLSIGLSPEEPVAVYLDRSPALVIAIFAILKAGGA